MHILTELSLIFALCLAGEGIAALLPVAFPASVISMLLLMALLLTGVVKERRIQTVSRFLVTNMGLFFIPSLVGTMEYVEVLRAQALPLSLIHIYNGCPVNSFVLCDIRYAQFSPQSVTRSKS